VYLMGAVKEEDLVALREAFRRLETAVSISDLPSVESATAELRDLMIRVGVASSVVQERDLALVRQLDAASEDLSALLDSRLRAFQLAISAWQGPESGR
jgi:hypothetical protein